MNQVEKENSNSNKILKRKGTTLGKALVRVYSDLLQDKNVSFIFWSGLVAIDFEGLRKELKGS